MPRLKLARPLMALVPDEERAAAPAGRPIPLRGQCWPAVAQELRERFPDLARRVLTNGDDIVSGFVLVVNDEVMSRHNPSIEFGTDDEICLIVALAGGCA